MKHSLVHGDFYVRHLLIGEERQLAGVIDWGDLHVGDPAIDLAIAHSFLPTNAHSSFKQAYGEISNETWGLAKLRAIHSSSVILLFGHYLSDRALADEGSRSLRLIATPSLI